MRHAFNGESDIQARGTLSQFSVLPAYCCQAAGGDPDWAEDLTLGWLLFYMAADLMDSVQDGDEPDAWWAEQGAGAALAAASGLYFSGSLLLNRMHDNIETKDAATEIVHNFYRAFLVMTSGQYNDILNRKPTLEQYWQHAESKSGAFFGLACWSGARLASSEISLLEAYKEYGTHLGMLIQVLDDLDDIRLLREKLHPTQLGKITRSLPVVYALEVSPSELRARLESYLDSATQDQDAAAELVKLLDQCGSAMYVQLELEKHRAGCLNALDKANPPTEIKDKLEALVRKI